MKSYDFFFKGGEVKINIKFIKWKAKRKNIKMENNEGSSFWKTRWIRNQKKKMNE